VYVVEMTRAKNKRTREGEVARTTDPNRIYNAMHRLA
jgi:hypothetical protein